MKFCALFIFLLTYVVIHLSSAVDPHEWPNDRENVMRQIQSINRKIPKLERELKVW